ncbi:MAG: radical SAM family heme chaperone HemW [Ectothiorhodospira sp.]
MPTPPLALYVHIPWCVRKCPYCDFNSHGAREIPEAAYLQALLGDLETDLERLPHRTLTSVFIGGGTPSLFSPAAIGRLLERVADRPGLAADAEITLEANPGTLERARFRGFRDAGINRLSIGAQSLDDTLLRRLGRIHDARAVVDAVAAARDAGFANLNLDLMCALPGQTPAQARADLEAALALEPDHLSWYELTLEPDTAFGRSPPKLPDEDTCMAMQEAGWALLDRAGFEHYEVSAHARPGHHCRHNLNYWRFGDYLGIGAGAETLDPKAATFDFVLNGLRLAQGVPTALFTAHTGLPPAHLEPARGMAVARGLLEERTDRLRPTALGWRYLDDLVALFLPEGGN